MTYFQVLVTRLIRRSVNLFFEGTLFGIDVVNMRESTVVYELENNRQWVRGSRVLSLCEVGGKIPSPPSSNECVIYRGKEGAHAWSPTRSPARLHYMHRRGRRPYQSVHMGFDS